MNMVPRSVMTSLIARWTSSGPPATSPTALREACTITTSPAARPNADRSSTSCARVNTGGISTEAGFDGAGKKGPGKNGAGKKGAGKNGAGKNGAGTRAPDAEEREVPKGA